MPVTQCRQNGKPGWKWGEDGRCYTYTEGNQMSSAMARARAELQGRAIEANKTKENRSS